ncbi:PrsW family intramembrane metalloprotease [Candidatus Giovannonibacteria bacterium]|nr:PrsW family intramembrane metalloprotease [Candidatus Giovannonibacteria bacterium]
MLILNNLLITILLGVIPALLWLWFWLKEDDNPEPPQEIFIVFIAGMFGVVVALILEHLISDSNEYARGYWGYGMQVFQIVNLIGFAFAEEIIKTCAVILTAFKSPYVDEPVDAMIYMVAAAMGFAAMENMFFIADGIQTTGINQSILVSAFRFINAVLIHATTATLIGAGFSFSFFHRKYRVKEVAFAIFAATVLHALYNYFILGSENSVFNQIGATFIVASGAIMALILFERARRVHI